MAIPVNKGQKCIMFLESADDRMEVRVNGLSVVSLNVGEPGKKYDLRGAFQVGNNAVVISGFDDQPVNASIRFKVEVDGKEVWADSKSEASKPPYPRNWYSNEQIFDVQ
jgi:type II restriction/modification system DNA methylase subunit YeeA